LRTLVSIQTPRAYETQSDTCPSAMCVLTFAFSPGGVEPPSDPYKESALTVELRAA
jgi:hypothetical protein